MWNPTTKQWHHADEYKRYIVIIKGKPKSNSKVTSHDYSRHAHYFGFSVLISTYSWPMLLIIFWLVKCISILAATSYSCAVAWVHVCPLFFFILCSVALHFCACKFMRAYFSFDLSRWRKSVSGYKTYGCFHLRLYTSGWLMRHGNICHYPHCIANGHVRYIYLIIEETLSVKKHKLWTIRPIGFLEWTETYFYSNTTCKF